MTPTRSAVAKVLDSLPLPTVLQCLAVVQARQARDDVLLGLLQNRLAQLTSAPAKPQDHELLTADEAAARLKLSRVRVYELVRLGQLAKVPVLEKQIPIPVSALHNHQPQSEA